MSIRAFLVCFLDRKTYYEKLSKLFVEDQNFEKVINYDHEIDFKNYNKLLNETLGRTLNQKTLKSLETNHSISSAFGLIKLHKPEKDLRMWGTIFEISQKTFMITPFCREFSTEFLKA